jgi:hypothetical protein
MTAVEGFYMAHAMAISTTMIKMLALILEFFFCVLIKTSTFHLPQLLHARLHIEWDEDFAFACERWFLPKNASN